MRLRHGICIRGSCGRQSSCVWSAMSLARSSALHFSVAAVSCSTTGSLIGNVAQHSKFPASQGAHHCQASCAMTAHAAGLSVHSFSKDSVSDTKLDNRRHHSHVGWSSKERRVARLEQIHACQRARLLASQQGKGHQSSLLSPWSSPLWCSVGAPGPRTLLWPGARCQTTPCNSR